MKCAICGKRVLGIVKVVHMWRHFGAGEVVRLVKVDGKVEYCQVVPAVLNAEACKKDERTICPTLCGDGKQPLPTEDCHQANALARLSGRDWLRTVCDVVSVDWFLRL